MEDVAKVVAGFAGGVAADEGVRHLTKPKVPKWAEALKNRYDLAFVTEKGETVLAKKLLRVYNSPLEKGNLSNYQWGFLNQPGRAPTELFGFLNITGLPKHDLHRAIINKAAPFPMRIYLDGELEAEFPGGETKKDNYRMATGYYKRDFPIG